MKQNRHVTRAFAVVLGLLMAVAEFYPLRNLAAAMLIFSMLFGVVAALFAMLFIADELAEKAVARCGSWLAFVRGHHAAPGMKM